MKAQDLEAMNDRELGSVAKRIVGFKANRYSVAADLVEAYRRASPEVQAVIMRRVDRLVEMNADLLKLLAEAKLGAEREYEEARKRRKAAAAAGNAPVLRSDLQSLGAWMEFDVRLSTSPSAPEPQLNPDTTPGPSF